jgi:uncharacterized protein (TIGR03032 family)
VDLDTGKFEAITFCPGYVRGLAFWQNWAIVGLSKPRGGDNTFSGLELDELLAAKDAEPRCGMMAIDLTNGAIVHWLRFEGIVTELYLDKFCKEFQSSWAVASGKCHWQI